MIKMDRRLLIRAIGKYISGVLLLSLLLFIPAGTLSYWNDRFHWSILPNWLVISATLIFIIAYLIYAEVLCENSYLSRTIEIQEDQKDIDTGLYGSDFME